MRRSVVTTIGIVLLLLLAAVPVAADDSPGNESGHSSSDSAHARFSDGPQQVALSMGLDDGVVASAELDKFFYINLRICDYEIPKCWQDTGEISHVRYSFNPAGARLEADVEMRSGAEFDWVHVSAVWDVATPAKPETMTVGHSSDLVFTSRWWNPDVTSVTVDLDPMLIEMEIPKLQSAEFRRYESRWVSK